jgi:hypothetical protein
MTVQARERCVFKSKNKRKPPTMKARTAIATWNLK